MALHRIFLLLELVWAIGAAVAAAQALPDCEDHCGSINIPYPFGIRKGCYLDDSFLITCSNYTESFLGNTNTSVRDISLLDGHLRISSSVAYICYNDLGNLTDWKDPFMNFSKFSVSNTKNKFIAVGCDTYAYIRGSRQGNQSTGCMSLCDKFEDVQTGSCSGMGCCQTDIPKGITDFDLRARSFEMYKGIQKFSPRGFAFAAEEGTYHFNVNDLSNLRNIEAFPVVLDWAIGNMTCEQASTNACGQNSYCDDHVNRIGYLCKCFEGFRGNPYLPNGCQDINECENATLNPCTHNCVNTRGSYKCSCRKGYHGDGRRDGSGCSSVWDGIKSILIKVTGGIGVAILVIGCSWLYWRIKRRKLIECKDNFFKQNGGLMLQQQLSKQDGSIEAVKIFTIEELKKATNDFHESTIIGRGGFGTVYKGVLPGNKIVAIKKSLLVDQSQIEQFVNEVIVLSQINHRNVVRLLGCCLETEVPLLVYEFITNGTLFHHIHEVDHASTIPWEIRLRIAQETAGALSYLHFAASTPIIHRDVKPTNILLDDNFIAKVSDFGASRLVPLDKTQLTTMVQGTLGYLDPEYFHTSQLSEKSDVYSFGVVLVELLTARKALSFDMPEKERNLATYFLSSMKENKLSQILDHQIVNEGNVEQVHEVANLAQSCLRLNGDERPTMKEVAIELEGLAKVQKHHWVGLEVNPEETEHLLSESMNFGSTSTSTVAGYDSLKNQFVIPLDDGR